MRFPAVFGTRSGRLPYVVEPLGEMREGRYVVEPAIGEGRAVKALGRRKPANLAVQAVVVVVADERLESGFGVVERAEHAAIQDLALQRRPERLDLAVGPGRVDLGLDVSDLKLAQRLAE